MSRRQIRAQRRSVIQGKRGLVDPLPPAEEDGDEYPPYLPGDEGNAPDVSVRADVVTYEAAISRPHSSVRGVDAGRCAAVDTDHPASGHARRHEGLNAGELNRRGEPPAAAGALDFETLDFRHQVTP